MKTISSFSKKDSALQKDSGSAATVIIIQLFLSEISLMLGFKSPRFINSQKMNNSIIRPHNHKASEIET